MIVVSKVLPVYCVGREPAEEIAMRETGYIMLVSYPNRGLLVLLMFIMNEILCNPLFVGLDGMGFKRCNPLFIFMYAVKL